jgi:hypothetical protein
MKNSCPVYEARVGALGSVRAWKADSSYCFTFFNGYDYTPLFLSEEAAYYTWLFLSMMHPEAYEVLANSSIKSNGSRKPAKKKPTVKKRQIKTK